MPRCTNWDQRKLPVDLAVLIKKIMNKQVNVGSIEPTEREKEEYEIGVHDEAEVGDKLGEGKKS